MNAVAEGEAAVRQARNETAAVIAGRAITITQLLAAYGALSKRVPYPRVLAAGIAAIVGQSTWASARAWGNGQPADRSAGWSDVVATTLGLATEAASWGSRDLPPDPRWSLAFSVIVSSWLPFELEDDDLPRAGLLWSAVYLATTSNRSPARKVGTVAGQRLGELFAAPVCSVYCRRFARQLRRQAHQLDSARVYASEQAAALAEDEERRRQFRVAHDSAIQVLEAVAGGWEVDEETLLDRIDFEIIRLQRVLEGGRLVEGGSLEAALSELKEEFRLSGLQVNMTVDGDVQCGPETVAALADAAHEALVNVRKHSGTATANVSARRVDAGGEVVVSDEGRGFDPEARHVGFGLDESMTRRLSAAGGRVEIASAPGAGTRVRLWCPDRSPRSVAG